MNDQTLWSALPEGVYPALATPLTDSGDLADDVLDRLTDRVIDDGVTGIAVLGSTGEVTTLAPSLRAAVQRRVAARASGRVPVLTGVADTVFDRVRAGLEEAAQNGMSAALVPPPFYYPLSPAEVARFYTDLAEASPIPLVLYNIPPYTKVELPVHVVADLAAHPRIIGLKDSGGRFLYLQELVAATRDQSFTVVTGSDEMLLASLAVGASGTICAAANAVAPFQVAILRLFKEGRLERARDVQARLTALVNICRQLGGYKAWKAVLEIQGFSPCRVAAPYESLPEDQKTALKQALEALGDPA
jgi:4-hydroxy-tetrahydrodipicolinate synthase